jgi:hypothetical protein
MGSVYHLRQIMRLDLVLLPRLLIYLEVSVFDMAEFRRNPSKMHVDDVPESLQSSG